MLDLTVAIEQHHGGARRRVGGERAIEPLAGPGLLKRGLEGRPHEIEHLAIAL